MSSTVTATVEGLSVIKQAVREIGRLYVDRFERARRLFVEERACALRTDRATEYRIKSEVSKFFDVPYQAVCFAGSAQLGFSIYKDRLFVPATSDLDIACVNGRLFESAWTDVISSTRAFTDETKFSGLRASEIDLFKQSILRRGMIRIELMPRSKLSSSWQQFEERVSRANVTLFRRVSIAIYMNEYAFCWKQEASLAAFLAV